MSLVSDNGSLSYIKERYNEELLRFESIENKSTRFLTIITIMIASFGAIMGYQNTQLFNLLGFNSPQLAAIRVKL